MSWSTSALPPAVATRAAGRAAPGPCRPGWRRDSHAAARRARTRARSHPQRRRSQPRPRMRRDSPQTPRAPHPPPDRSAHRRAANPPSPRSRGRARGRTNVGEIRLAAEHPRRVPVPSAKAAKPTSHGCVVTLSKVRPVKISVNPPSSTGLSPKRATSMPAGTSNSRTPMPRKPTTSAANAGLAPMSSM